MFFTQILFFLTYLLSFEQFSVANFDVSSVLNIFICFSAPLPYRRCVNE